MLRAVFLFSVWLPQVLNDAGSFDLPARPSPEASRLRILARGKWRRELWLLALALLCLRPAGALAQTGGRAAASGQMKIAILNVRQAMVATTEGKEASAKLKSKFAAQQNDLQNMQKQIQELQNRLSNNQGMPNDEQARLQRQGELLTRQFQRKQDELNEEEIAAQSDVTEKIGRQMLNVVDRYSREHGYVIVLDISAQGTPVVYGSSEIDISNDIVRLYDQAYPVKAAGDRLDFRFCRSCNVGQGAISRSSAFHCAKEAL